MRPLLILAGALTGVAPPPPPKTKPYYCWVDPYGSYLTVQPGPQGLFAHVHNL